MSPNNHSITETTTSEEATCDLNRSEMNLSNVSKLKAINYHIQANEKSFKEKEQKYFKLSRDDEGFEWKSYRSGRRKV